MRASGVGLRFVTGVRWDGGVNRAILLSVFSLWEQLLNRLDSSWLAYTSGFSFSIVGVVGGGGVSLGRVLLAPRLVESRAGTNRLRKFKPSIMLVLLHL